LMFGACLWLRYVDLRTLFGHRLMRGAGLVMALGIVLHFARLGPDHWMGQIVLTMGFLALFAGGGWALVLDKTDKGFVTNGIDSVLAALTKATVVR